MSWWLDIEETNGDRVGPGPLRSAVSFEVTHRLDAAGKFKLKASLSEARASMVQAKRRVRAWGLVDGTVTDLGAGIIDKIGVDIDLNLDISGDDLLRELTYTHVGRLLIGASGSPSTTGPAQIAALFPTGWSLDTINGYNATIKPIHHRYEGETCLAALIKLAELTGEHFRLGTGRTIVWMQKDQANSGVRAVQGGESVSLEGNPDVCSIIDLQEELDSYDCLAGRMHAYGIGDGDARISLAGTSISVPGWTVGSDATGYYLQHTATWNAYGINRYMSFKDINDSATLLEIAYEWMRNRLTLPAAYKVSVAKLDRVIPVGSTIRMVYKRVLNGVTVLDIDTDLVVLETTVKLDDDGLRTMALKVATVPLWPDNAANAVSSVMSTARNFYSHTQGFSSGAPVNAQYVVLAANTVLTDERVFTPDSTLSVVDDGPGGQYHIGVATEATPLTVAEQDGVPSVANVNTIKVSNGSLTDDGGGVVSLVTGGGGGGGALDDLTDVDVAGVTDGQVLAFDDDTSTWIPATVSSPTAYVGAEISRTVVGAGGAASIDIQNIPAGYDYLEVRIIGKTERSADIWDSLLMYFNNDTTAGNYHADRSYAGDADHGLTEYDTANVGDFPAVNGKVGSIRVIIPYYDNTLFYKTSRSHVEVVFSDTDSYVMDFARFWKSTSAITRITIQSNSGSDLAENTVVILIGYKNVVGGGVGSIALDDLTDVNVAGVTDGQALTYDDASALWIPTTVSGSGTVDGSGATDQVAVWLDSDTLLGDTGLTYDPDTNTLLVSDGTIISKSTGEHGIILDPNHAGHLSGSFNVILLAPTTMTADAILTLPARNMILSSSVSSFSITGGGTPKTLTVNDSGVAALLNVANTFTKTAVFQRDAVSTAAFAVQDPDGQNILDVDTVNQRVVIGNGRSVPVYTLDVTYDTTTYWLSNIIQVARFGRNCGDYPSAGFGESAIFTLGTYTNDDRSAGALSYLWADPTDATRKARGILSAWDTAERECIRFEASGSAPMVGFFGHAAAAQPAAYTITNANVDRAYDANATNIDEIADSLATLIADLQTLGIIG